MSGLSSILADYLSFLIGAPAAYINELVWPEKVVSYSWAICSKQFVPPSFVLVVCSVMRLLPTTCLTMAVSCLPPISSRRRALSYFSLFWYLTLSKLKYWVVRSCLSFSSFFASCFDFCNSPWRLRKIYEHGCSLVRLVSCDYRVCSPSLIGKLSWCFSLCSNTCANVSSWLVTSFSFSSLWTHS